MIFPFLPFMVQDFFPELTPEEWGSKAGFLGSAFFLGSFCGSLLVRKATVHHFFTLCALLTAHCGSGRLCFPHYLTNQQEAHQLSPSHILLPDKLESPERKAVVS